MKYAPSNTKSDFNLTEYVILSVQENSRIDTVLDASDI